MLRSVFLFGVLAQALSAQSAPAVRRAVARALPPLERSAATFVAKRACVSCHHNILPILMFHLARSRGVSFDPAVLAAVEEKTFRGLRSLGALDDALQAATLNDPTPNESYLLMAAHAAGLEPGLTTAVYARRLASWQRDGHWVTSDFRPPHSSSAFTATATAVRAIRLYLPEELREERDMCLLRARRWLLATRPESTEDAAFRLMGLLWADAPQAEADVARKDLTALQQPNGGWPELPGYRPDAYSTGEALFALYQAGKATGPAREKAIRFLISTQDPAGTWRVRTRMLSPASVSPTYFPTGFPYQKDEYLSYAGSCWAVMALLSALPESPRQPENAKLADAAAADAAPWVRTTLFGTTPQLAALLDAGLDPDSQTGGGTTLLMMVAHDAPKVRLLLARGADPKLRAASGCDALTIAAAYRGTAGAIEALLGAGAEWKAPEGVRPRNTPLVFASLTGDLDNVKLLLAHGADPAAGTRANTPLAAAVTFGYTDVVQTLIAAGAPASITENTGINLLHWAVIANRPAVIPALVAAKVPIDAADESGYTPLMYAATIDFGDTRAVKALLAAGADPNIRNGEGRTAREQARHYQHTRLAVALR